MSDLVGEYKLVSHNGNTDEAASQITLSLSAADGGALRVHAKVANNMNGQIKEDGGKWKGMLMSTMMMGPPFHMGVERALSTGFHEGATITKSDGKLTFVVGADTLVFQ